MKHKSLVGRWMQNNYLLFIISVVISLLIWVYISFNSPNTDTTFTIGDVPIQIELSEEASKQGLQVFPLDEPVATVTVSGNRTVLGLLNENDLTVTAAAGSATTTGTFSLPVSANKRTTRGNFQITASSPQSINVMLDYRKESEFEITDGITYYLEDGYYGVVSLPYSRVLVSGPQTEVLKIKKVVAKASISEKLKETRVVDTRLVLYDENNKEISKKLLNLSVDNFQATVSVMPEKTVPVEPVFLNKPDGVKITADMMTVEPAQLQLAGPADTLGTITSAQLDPIDFSKLKNETITLEDKGINIPENCRSISNTATAKVTLDLSGYEQKSFTVDQFVADGLPKGYDCTITSKSLRVTIIGSSEQLSALTSANITAVINTSDFSGKTGSVEMPVTFRIKDADTCWAYGSYLANITITKKS